MPYAGKADAIVTGGMEEALSFLSQSNLVFYTIANHEASYK